MVSCVQVLTLSSFVLAENPHEVKMPEYKKKLFQVAVDDVTTVEEGQVYVRADGIVKIVKRKRKNKQKANRAPNKKIKLE